MPTNLVTRNAAQLPTRGPGGGPPPPGQPVTGYTVMLPNGITMPLPDIPGGWEGRRRQFAMYDVAFSTRTLTSLGTLSGQIYIDSGQDFFAFAGVGTSTVAAGTVNAAILATVQITPNTNNEALFNQPVHARNVFGSATNPAFFPFPIWLKRSTAVTFALTSLDTAASQLIYLTLWGFRLYDKGA